MRFTSSGFVLRSVETLHERQMGELISNFRQNLERLKDQPRYPELPEDDE